MASGTLLKLRRPWLRLGTRNGFDGVFVTSEILAGEMEIKKIKVRAPLR